MRSEATTCFLTAINCPVSVNVDLSICYFSCRVLIGPSGWRLVQRVIVWHAWETVLVLGFLGFIYQSQDFFVYSLGVWCLFILLPFCLLIFEQRGLDASKICVFLFIALWLDLVDCWWSARVYHFHLNLRCCNSFILILICGRRYLFGLWTDLLEFLLNRMQHWHLRRWRLWSMVWKILLRNALADW